MSPLKLYIKFFILISKQKDDRNLPHHSSSFLYYKHFIVCISGTHSWTWTKALIDTAYKAAARNQLSYIRILAVLPEFESGITD